MILKIYKSRSFRFTVYFFIAIILNACTTDYIIKSLSYSDLEASSVTKIYLRDGKTLDLTNSGNPNQITGLNENELTYKNKAGNTFTLLKEQIDYLYSERFSFFNTLLCAVGITFLLLVIFLAIALHDFHGFAG